MSGLSLASMMKFAPLMGKRLEELTVKDVSAVLAELGSPVVVNEELLNAGLALLQGQDIHTVADIIKSPDSVMTLVNFMARGAGLASSDVDDVIDGSVLINHNPTQTLITATPGWRLPG